MAMEILGKDDRTFIYNQLSARKWQLEEELDMWMQSKNRDEVIRVSGLINELKEIMTKIL